MAATNGIDEVIRRLESQKAAVEQALEALRGVYDGEGASAGTASPAKRGNAGKSKTRRGLSPEGRRRLALAMKRRWAAKRTAGQAKKAARKRA